MEAEIFVPFVLFAFLTAVIIVPIMSKERTKRSAHELVSQALARGQTLEPALIEKLSTDMQMEGDRARKSLGKGVILTMLAIGLVGAAYFGDGWDEGAMVPAVIVGALGAAFLLLALVDYLGKNRPA